MLLNLGTLSRYAGTVLIIVLVIVLLKTITVAVSAYLVGETLSSGLRSGFNLSQIGEFSFFLAVTGVGQGLMDQKTYQLFLSASVISMMITPFMMRLSSPVSMWLTSRRIFRELDRWRRREEIPANAGGIEDHVVVIGFGVNGSNIARALRESDVTYAIVESNSALVRKARQRGEPIRFGDASSLDVLHKAGVESARLLVIVISDPAATRRIVQTARNMNPHLHIIVRTRLVAEVDHLLSLGADEVVPEEFETSVEIFAKVLHYYGVPANIIRDRIETVRLGGYLAFRTLELPQKFLAERPELLKNVRVETYLIKEGSKVIDGDLKQLNLRALTGGTVIGVERGKSLHRMPPPSFRLAAGDVLFLVGTREDVRKAVDHLDELAAEPQG
jgi:CPA2 family monovalent cation:H+ antiporter-2